MKAHIEQRKQARFRITGARWTPSRPIPKDWTYKTLELWGRNTSRVFHRTSKWKIYSSLRRRWEMPIDNFSLLQGMNFVDSLHMTVIPEKGSIIGYPWNRGRFSPQKYVIDLDSLLGTPLTKSYSGTLEILKCIELDYVLYRIRCL